MWGTFLSEPLTIDGTVGRYPAVYLIVRIPIRKRQAFSANQMSSKHHIGY